MEKSNISKRKSPVKRFIKFVVNHNKMSIFTAMIMVIFITSIDLVLPMMTKNMVDKGITGKNLELLLKIIVAYSVMSVLARVLNLALGYIYATMRNRVAVKFRLKVLDHLSKLSGKFYTENKTGNLMSIVQSDIDIIENIDAELVFSIIKNSITAIISLYLMFRLQSVLFVVVVFIQILLVTTQRYFTKNIHSNVSMFRDEYGDTSNVVQEYVYNIMNVIISKSKRFFISQFIKGQRGLINKDIKIDVLMSGNMCVANIFNLMMSMAIYGYGGYMIINGDFTLGSLIAFQNYAGMLIGPCISIVNANNRIQQAKVSIERVYSILDEEPVIDEDQNMLEGLRADNIKEISVENVKFGYENDELEKKYILNNVSMKFKRGDISAIVGESGCGKSTLSKLMYRLWDVDDGSIKIDERDIRNIKLMSLRKCISVVSQEIVIFDSTIRNNISLGKKIPDDDILRVCSLAGLDDFISSLEAGLDTEIGEKGIKISGGQKQRISIARAMLCDSPIIIFDEATSALDNVSQDIIMDSIKKNLEDRIVIVIAHRLSTIKDVDKIFVMSNGKIAESGNHEELISKKGIYYKLYRNE